METGALLRPWKLIGPDVGRCNAGIAVDILRGEFVQLCNRICLFES